MLDPKRLFEFKRVTREDELIADELFELLRGEAHKSILEVGAGPGVVSNRLLAHFNSLACRTVVEPQECYSYSGDTQVYRTRWEDYMDDKRYDLVVMSHVIGHFIIQGRGEIVATGIDFLAEGGSLVIVENAPMEPFWGLNLEIGRRQSTQYIVDFDELEEAIKRRGATLIRKDLVLPLYLGRTLKEQLRNFNVLFPVEFDDEQRKLVLSCWDELVPNRDGWLQLCQRFYVAKR